MRPVYEALARRSGRWWAVEVPGGYKDGGALWTQARRLDQVEHMARDAIALMREVAADSFDLRVVPVLDPQLSVQVEHAAELRSQADAVQREATAALRQAADLLVHDLDLPLRDAGAILGLSHQRIAQLLRHTKAPAA
jgi:hypothetical protein